MLKTDFSQNCKDFPLTCLEPRLHNQEMNWRQNDAEEKRERKSDPSRNCTRHSLLCFNLLPQRHCRFLLPHKVYSMQALSPAPQRHHDCTMYLCLFLLAHIAKTFVSIVLLEFTTLNLRLRHPNSKCSIHSLENIKGTTGGFQSKNGTQACVAHSPPRKAFLLPFTYAGFTPFHSVFLCLTYFAGFHSNPVIVDSANIACLDGFG